MSKVIFLYQISCHKIMLKNEQINKCVNSRKGNQRTIMNPPYIFLPCPACSLVCYDITGSKYSSRQLFLYTVFFLHIVLENIPNQKSFTNPEFFFGISNIYVSIVIASKSYYICDQLLSFYNIIKQCAV